MFPLLTLNLYDDKYKLETLINEGLPYLKYIGHRVKKYREGIPLNELLQMPGVSFTSLLFQ